MLRPFGYPSAELETFKISISFSRSSESFELRTDLKFSISISQNRLNPFLPMNKDF